MFDINWNEKEYTKEEAMRFLQLLSVESIPTFEDIFNPEGGYSLEDVYDTCFTLSESLKYEVFPIDDSIDVFVDPDLAIGEFSEEASSYFYAAEQDIEESLIYRYAVWQAINGEFDPEEFFPIDETIDIVFDPPFSVGSISEDVCMYYFSDSQSLDDSDMFKYAVWQAMQGEFDSPKNYYNWHPEIECYKVSQHFPGNLAQAIQYIWRSGGPVVKDNVKQDLEKAIDFIQYEIERLDK